MINQNLHRQPTPLDRSTHRAARVQVPVTDWSVAAKLNSMFVAAVEFGDVCREYPVVFVRAGNDAEGKVQLAPVAVFGLTEGENLFILPDGRWRAHYLPAMIRQYPFAMGRVDEKTYAICVDMAWSGVSESEGTRLFGDDGEPSELTQLVQKQLEQIEIEVQRTRMVGERLMALDLMREMRFDATLPDGQTVVVQGFLTVDEDKLKAVSDADMLDLQRTGILALVHAHLISLGNMRHLAEWRAEREQAAKAN